MFTVMQKVKNACMTGYMHVYDIISWLTYNQLLGDIRKYAQCTQLHHCLLYLMYMYMSMYNTIAPSPAGGMDPSDWSVDGGWVPLFERLHSLHVFLDGWWRLMEKSALCT